MDGCFVKSNVNSVRWDEDNGRIEWYGNILLCNTQYHYDDGLDSVQDLMGKSATIHGGYVPCRDPCSCAAAAFESIDWEVKPQSWEVDTGTVHDFSKQVIWESSWPNLDAFLQYFLGFALLKSGDETFGVEIGPDRVLAKFFACHECVGRLDGVEVVHLRFQHVSVGIFVINRGRRPMVDAHQTGQIPRAWR